MFDLHPVILNAFIGLIGMVLLMFAWRAVSSLPALARWALRLILAAIIIVPFALLILAPKHEMARAPSQEPVARSDDSAAGDERSGSDDATFPNRRYRREITGDEARDTDVAAAPETPPAKPAPPPVVTPEAAAPTPPPASAPESMPDVAAPQAPGGTRGLGMSGAGRGGGGTGKGGIGIGNGTRGLGAGGTRRDAELPPVSRMGARSPAAANGGSDKSAAEPASGAEPSPVERESTAESAAPSAGAVGGEKEDWTVVPVYYGTDRARAPNDRRADYGSERGRRLELGRAMVSVPKAHEVPQIERPWAITIPYFNYKIYEQKEDPAKHFIIQEINAYSEADLIGLVKERLARSARYKDHAFVFVHGYNTTFDYAVFRAAQIAYDIKFDGAPFVYSWPSGGGIASYTYDRESSAQAEPYFTDFLKMVTQKTGAKHVSIIAHSMGNQLVLRVLQDLQRTRPEGVKISQIIFAAPDVDRDTFETIASQLNDFATGGITLYAAANDRALDVSKRFYGGVPRAGDVPETGPLIVPGIDTIDATAVSMDSLGLHHSGYAESNALLQDIGLLMQTGERPPSKRVPILQQVTTDKGNYWRYPGGP